MENYETANKILENNNSNEVVDLFEENKKPNVNMHTLKKLRVKNIIFEIKELIFKDIDNHFYENAAFPNHIEQSREKCQFLKHIAIIFNNIENVDICDNDDLEYCAEMAKVKIDMFDTSKDKKYGDIVRNEIMNFNELDFSIWFKKTYDL